MFTKHRIVANSFRAFTALSTPSFFSNHGLSLHMALVSTQGRELPQYFSRALPASAASARLPTRSHQVVAFLKSLFQSLFVPDVLRKLLTHVVHCFFLPLVTAISSSPFPCPLLAVSRAPRRSLVRGTSGRRPPPKASYTCAQSSRFSRSRLAQARHSRTPRD